jgi:dihydrofolate reductase
MTIIVAMDDNGLIGNKDTIPWHFPEDLKFFSAMTKSIPICIVGRKTWESILSFTKGKGLPHRDVYVLSRSTKAFRMETTRTGTVYWPEDPEECLKRNCAGPHPGGFIIGGRAIYEMALPLVDNLMVTNVPGDYSIDENDIYFPDVNWDEWRLDSEGPIGKTLTLRNWSRIK